MSLRGDILKLVGFATNKGYVTNVVNAAGVSPSQAPVAEILRVDLFITKRSSSASLIAGTERGFSHNICRRIARTAVLEGNR